MRALFGILSTVAGTAAVLSITGVSGLTLFLIPTYGFCSLMLGIYTGRGSRD